MGPDLGRGRRRLIAVIAVMALVWAAFPLGPAAMAIVGGHEVSPGDHPYVVAVVDATDPDTYTGHICGGAVVSSEWVMTAAHCVAQLSASAVDVVLDRLDLSSDSGERVGVSVVEVHPAYGGRRDNDLALLKLEEPVAVPSVMPASAENSTLWLPGTAAVVMGWGAAEDGNPTVLREVEVPVLSDATCSSIYGNKVNTSVSLCAGDVVAGEGHCRGDSGGPLVVDDGAGGVVAIGVVSWGNACSDPGRPGVFAEVAAFRDWIDATIAGGPPGEEPPEEEPPGEEPPGEEPPGEVSLMVSGQADRSDPVALDGAQVSDPIYIFLAATPEVTEVTFRLADQSPRTDGEAPFDLFGTRPDGTANPLKTTRLEPGEYVLEAVVAFDDGQTTVATATFYLLP